MAKPISDLHVVMLPWLAFGHLIPYHQLSIALAKNGVRVSYISTTRNIERLPQIPPELSPFMQYVSLPLPEVPGGKLPQGAEATVDMESNSIPYLKMAYDLLCEPVETFVSSHSPDWVISDFAAHWLPDVTQKSQIQLMFFSILPAVSMSFFGAPDSLTDEGMQRERPTLESLTTPPKWGEGIFPRSVAFRGYEVARFLHEINSSKASGISDGKRIAKLMKGCQAVGLRSCRESEAQYIDLYHTLTNKPVIPVGLLPQAKPQERADKDGPWNESFKWLDQQSPRSVIFVSFGSEYKLSQHEVYEIAYGLELAELPFIWVLRRPTWAADDFEALPPDFLNRTMGKGIVCFGWAPQLEILAHPSVGGSLFHSGSASTIETLQHGHTLILLPFFLDQGLIARVMVEKGLGVEVDRREEDGSYTRNDISIALKRAMVGDEAERIQERTTKAAQTFGDQKLHGEYIREFVKYLRNGTIIA